MDFKKGVVGEGLRLVSLTPTSKGHYKAVIEAADKSQTMTYVLASTNSDRRASKNRLSDIRRFFNN